MKKKRILFVYPSMMLGGSTTAMLSMMNSLDTTHYNVDLQLFHNAGPLLDVLPDHVTLLPEAQLYTGKKSKLIKMWKFFKTGYLFKCVWRGVLNKRIFSRELLSDFSAVCLSRQSETEYDYAIGYLEGWSDRYLSWKVKAKHKYAWIHSTFSKVTQDPYAELRWMENVDKIAFVTDSCRNDFVKSFPFMEEKAIVVKNIVDSEIIRKRGNVIDQSDREYLRFAEASCFKIITVCRLQMQVKGLDRILSAAEKLNKNGENFLWYIIGSGEDRGTLEQLICDKGLKEKVILIGARMNPYPFIKISDIMCMPSRYEGKPLVVTESMILGTPPVVTEYLSAHEQIQNGVDGIVVANADDSIVGAVERCMHDKMYVENMRKWLLDHEYGNKEEIRIIESNLL